MNIDDLLEKPELGDVKKAFAKLDYFLDLEMKKYTSKEIQDNMIEVFGNQRNAREWFYSELFFFGGKRPYDFCVKGKQEDVLNELINIKYGNLA